jgi:hypothetical protein
MADEIKSGRPWQDDELDAIIEDYFAMLKAEISGEFYVKSGRTKRLMAQLGRSHRSVEFKHENISAVLDVLGLPWIPGYKPKANFQKAIFPAIERYLASHPEVLQPVAPSQAVRLPSDQIFVEAPILVEMGKGMATGLRRLARKYDPAVRDEHNRSLGRAGEEFVVGVERDRLMAAECSDLAERVRWVAEEDGDGAGYDVLSFEPSGEERLLEVKTTNGSARTPFFLTRNEYIFAAERPKEWRIYRVHLFATERRIFVVAPPLEQSLSLRTETWRASFVNKVDSPGAAP